jgi:hypothetical protein
VNDSIIPLNVGIPHKEKGDQQQASGYIPGITEIIIPAFPKEMSHTVNLTIGMKCKGYAVNLSFKK